MAPGDESFILSRMSGASSCSIIEGVGSAPSFLEAATRLTEWALDLTGCQAAMMRFTQDEPQSAGWIPAVVEHGFGCRFLRDEILIGQEECLCGRVCRGCPEPAFPFFSSSGSFLWGRVQSIARDYPVDSLGNIRGRCIAEGFESVAIIPLRGTDGQPIGCLHLADFAPDKFAGYRETLEAVGVASGPLLQAFPAEEREEAVIRAVESALMPAEPPQMPGFDIAVSFSSATETAHLGGDFYDVITRGDREVLLIVGDYSGKGIGAAGMAARAREALARAAANAESPSALLAAAAETVPGLLPPGKFVTVAACLFSAAGTVTGVVAGHPSPIILEREGSLREVMLPVNPALGIFTHLHFTEGRVHLLPGQTVLLYTDGITESRREGEFFGLDGIAELWKGMSGGTLAEFTAGLCRTSAGYHQKDLAGDDRLALAIRLGPATCE
ncbi:MAG: SpoIIE family protein phosphatase [Actinobacteria bacterium]|nr:SpoIIE family protein phosphatase [Actinomycetota bacterium]